MINIIFMKPTYVLNLKVFYRINNILLWNLQDVNLSGDMFVGSLGSLMQSNSFQLNHSDVYGTNNIFMESNKSYGIIIIYIESK